MSDDARAGHREDIYGKTPNGLDIHVFDCPGDKLVTLWSSRFGVGKDNPSSSVIPVTSPPPLLRPRTMIVVYMIYILQSTYAGGPKVRQAAGALDGPGLGLGLT